MTKVEAKTEYFALRKKHATAMSKIDRLLGTGDWQAALVVLEESNKLLSKLLTLATIAGGGEARN